MAVAAPACLRLHLSRGSPAARHIASVQQWLPLFANSFTSAGSLPLQVPRLPSEPRCQRAYTTVGATTRVRPADVSGTATQSQTKRPLILWAPGEKASEDKTDRLAGKIGILCREDKGRYCIVGSRGRLPSARAMRALAKAGELGKSPIQFQTRWHEEADDSRALRFYAELFLTWKEFKEKMAAFPERPTHLSVTPHTDVHGLATAIVMEQRKKGSVVIRLKTTNDAVCYTCARALATLPHVAQSEERGAELVAVARWPSLQESVDTRNSEAEFMYVHVLMKSALE